MMLAVCTPDVEARRRRLEELFEDEPFLSATMRASRLHERKVPDRPEKIERKMASRRVDRQVMPTPIPKGAAEAKVARFGFVVNVRHEPQGLRAELQPAEVPEVMNAVEAARFMRVGQGTLRRLLREEGLPYTQIGRCRRFRKSAILGWLKIREKKR